MSPNLLPLAAFCLSVAVVAEVVALLALVLALVAAVVTRP